MNTHSVNICMSLFIFTNLHIYQPDFRKTVTHLSTIAPYGHINTNNIKDMRLWQASGTITGCKSRSAPILCKVTLPDESTHFMLTLISTTKSQLPSLLHLQTITHCHYPQKSCWGWIWARLMGVRPSPPASHPTNIILYIYSQKKIWDATFVNCAPQLLNALSVDTRRAKLTLLKILLFILASSQLWLSCLILFLPLFFISPLLVLSCGFYPLGLGFGLYMYILILFLHVGLIFYLILHDWQTCFCFPVQSCLNVLYTNIVIIRNLVINIIQLFLHCLNYNITIPQHWPYDAVLCLVLQNIIPV